MIILLQPLFGTLHLATLPLKPLSPALAAVAHPSAGFGRGEALSARWQHGWELVVYRRYGKRLLDLILAGLGLLLLSPLYLIVAALVRLKLGAPVLFRQERPGLHGRFFTLYKFRTMTDARDHTGALLPDAQRLTPFGAWLRSTSLDELPELWNVLKGEMSLIGPRPLIKEYLPLYTPEQRRRHEVRPGITGWAQIHGRNCQSWEQRFALDLWYVEHCSFWLDLTILWRTAAVVLSREGVSANGHVTMPRFTGSSQRQGSYD